MVKISVLDRNEATEYLPKIPTVAIRCMSSYRNRFHDYSQLKGSYVGILPLVFDDIRKLEESGYGIIFREWHALRIKKFMEENMNKFEELMVHCDAGGSRSVAVASALGDHYRWEYDGEILVRRDDGRNPIVYERLMNVLKK